MLPVKDMFLPAQSGFVLRERRTAFLLNRVLCCENEERLRQLISNSRCSYLVFLHRFKKCSLSFRRCSVDFVCKNDVREYRSGNKFEISFLADGIFFNYFCSGNIARHQIGSELYPAEFQI